MVFLPSGFSVQISSSTSFSPFSSYFRVTFPLQERGDDVLLTITHRRVADPTVLLNVSAGWHSHVDVLEAKLRGTAATPHWDNFVRLRDDYTARLAS